MIMGSHDDDGGDGDDNDDDDGGCQLDELRLPWLPHAMYHLVSFMCICDYVYYDLRLYIVGN